MPKPTCTHPVRCYQPTGPCVKCTPVSMHVNVAEIPSREADLVLLDAQSWLQNCVQIIDEQASACDPHHQLHRAARPTLPQMSGPLEGDSSRFRCTSRAGSR